MPEGSRAAEPLGALRHDVFRPGRHGAVLPDHAGYATSSSTTSSSLGETCKRRAFEFQKTLCVGRTHGIHAEPMTFGMKFGSWAWALKRALTRMEEARAVAATGAISGAVGTYSSIDPFVEQYVCEKLGLTPDPLSTQVLARDRHAQVMAALAVTASTLESIAMQVRLLQQSDVIEAEEPFTKGQKGSSAMPHKRNPITAERVCGLARVVKANAQVAFDNAALWYERDISHSGAERVALADSFIGVGLHVRQDAVDARRPADLSGQDGAQPVAHEGPHLQLSKVLLALVDAGISREDAYVIVQRNAMKVWEDIQNAVDGPTYRENARKPTPRPWRCLPRRSSTRSSIPGTSSPARTSCSIACRSWSSSSSHLLPARGDQGRPLRFNLGSHFAEPGSAVS